MYNTEVGYCQGMSQIAAILLMYMDEEVNQLNQAIISSMFSYLLRRVCSV